MSHNSKDKCIDKCIMQHYYSLTLSTQGYAADWQEVNLEHAKLFFTFEKICI